MNAIYRGRLYHLSDDLNMVRLTDAETDREIMVPYSAPELIIDPTDDEINNILPDYEEPTNSTT